MTKRARFTKENYKAILGCPKAEMGILNAVYEADGYVCARKLVKDIGEAWETANMVFPHLDAHNLISIKREGGSIRLGKGLTPTSRINLMPERVKLRDIRKVYCRSNPDSPAVKGGKREDIDDSLLNIDMGKFIDKVLIGEAIKDMRDQTHASKNDDIYSNKLLAR
jgi:hypothetical protein